MARLLRFCFLGALFCGEKNIGPVAEKKIIFSVLHGSVGVSEPEKKKRLQALLNSSSFRPTPKKGRREMALEDLINAQREELIRLRELRGIDASNSLRRETPSAPAPQNSLSTATISLNMQVSPTQRAANTENRQDRSYVKRIKGVNDFVTASRGGLGFGDRGAGVDFVGGGFGVSAIGDSGDFGEDGPGSFIRDRENFYASEMSSLRRQAAEDSVAILTTKLAEAEEKLFNCLTLVEEEKLEKNRVKAELVRVSVDRDTLNDSFLSLTEKYDAQYSKFEACSTELEGLRGKVKEAKEEAADSEDIVRSLRQQGEENVMHCSHLMDQLEEKNKSLKEREETISSLQDENKRLGLELDEVQKENILLRVAITKPPLPPPYNTAEEDGEVDVNTAVDELVDDIIAEAMGEVKTEREENGDEADGDDDDKSIEWEASTISSPKVKNDHSKYIFTHNNNSNGSTNNSDDKFQPEIEKEKEEVGEGEDRGVEDFFNKTIDRRSGDGADVDGEDDGEEDRYDGDASGDGFGNNVVSQGKKQIVKRHRLYTEMSPTAAKFLNGNQRLVIRQTLPKKSTIVSKRKPQKKGSSTKSPSKSPTLKSPPVAEVEMPTTNASTGTSTSRNSSSVSPERKLIEPTPFIIHSPPSAKRDRKIKQSLIPDHLVLVPSLNQQHAREKTPERKKGKKPPVGRVTSSLSATKRKKVARKKA